MNTRHHADRLASDAHVARGRYWVRDLRSDFGIPFAAWTIYARGNDGMLYSVSMAERHGETRPQIATRLRLERDLLRSSIDGWRLGSGQ